MALPSMTTLSLEEKIAGLQDAIASLEARRAELGDAVVEISVAALREKLRALEPEAAARQRKLVTVLFADLVGFTPMAELLDPEDVRDVLERYFAPWQQAVGRYGGRLEKYIGDAVMAVFGVPLATELDAENAIRAALAVRDGLGELNARLEQRFGIRLAMRVGIHTGIVLVAKAGDTGDLAVTGDTVNLASRLEGQAPPGGILISHDAYRHVRGAFDVQVQEQITVKGRAEPVLTYLVEQARPRVFHRGMRRVEGIEAPMIGREAELQRLQDALLGVVNDGQHRAVTVVGEAGVGKSRLLFEFENWADVLPQRFFLFKGRASQDRQGVPYGLVRDLFAFRFQIRDNDSPPVVWAKMEEGFGQTLGAGGQAQAHFVGQLLGFDFSGSPHLQEAQGDARQVRDRSLVYLAGYFRAVTERLATVILLEDLHWADDSSLDLLDSLALSLANRPLLIVGLARPGLLERRPDWGGGRSFHRQIDLDRLPADACRRLVEEILREARPVPEGLLDLVTGRAEGNPFYVEELIKMLIEEEVIVPEPERWRVKLARLGAVPIPPTLVGVLQARLDGLAPEERSAVQQAAVVGRIFWDQAVVHLRERVPMTAGDLPSGGQSDVAPALAALRAKEMVFRRRTSAFAGTEEFIFKHALLHEVAYESVLRRLRRSYHALVAEWLVEQAGERMVEHAGLIADHLEATGDAQRAIPYLRRAGEEAASRFANAEAIAYLSRALELAAGSEPADRYALLLAREKVYDVQGARQAQAMDLAELERLAQGLCDPRRQAEVALRRAGYAEATGDFSDAVSAAQAVIELTHASQDVVQEAAGYRHWGRALWHQGTLAAARPKLLQALALARQGASPWDEAQILRDLGVVCAQLGDEEEALDRFEGALRLCVDLGDRRGEGMILNNLGILYRVQGDYEGASACAERALAIRRAIGDRRGEATLLNTLGLIHRHCGRYGQAAACYRQSAQIAHELGDRWTEGRTLGNLGNAYADLGDYASARRHMEQGLRLAHEINDRHAQVVSTGGLANISYRARRSRYPDDLPANEGYGEADRYARQALEMSQEIGDPDQQAHLRTTLAHCQLGVGNVTEARAEFERALKLWRELGHEHRALEPLAGLMQVALAEGDLLQGQRLVAQILECLPDGMAGGSEHALWGHLVCYQFLKAVHDPRALEILHAAHALLQEQAAQIEDPALRRSFLENVGVHRELVHELGLAQGA
jgi:class 3 adenylate cyclase/tetratricopeptide (TPR) repeat protein